MKAYPLSLYQVPMLALIAGVSLGLTPSATAQTVEFPDPAAVHLQEDSANTPMPVFEANANPKAGLNPQLISASAPPEQVGKWSQIIATCSPLQCVVPIFAALLPDGRVLFWDSVGPEPTESYHLHTSTRAAVWDPKTSPPNFKDVSLKNAHNLFCAGFAHLTDGQVFTAGGNKNSNLDGIKQTYIFNYYDDMWYRGPDMASERWYPSVATLPDGEHVIMGGGPSVPEVTQGSWKNIYGWPDSFRRLTNGKWGSHAREYPFVQTAPNGKVLYAGPKKRMALLSTENTGLWQTFGNRDAVYRYYGSYAMFNIGTVLVAGGGSAGALPKRSAVVINWNGPTPVASSTGNMNYRRRQHNLTLLPGGGVLATGGLSSKAGLVDLNAAVYYPEVWNPQTGTWKMLAPQAVARQYHSVALLLPDGRVMSGGGGVCGICKDKGYLRADMEIYYPPYLFKKDGSGALAARPLINWAPDEVDYGVPFNINVISQVSISKIALTKLPAVTHGQDMDQRYVPVSFSSIPLASGNLQVTVTPPASHSIAPPGHYMLWVIDSLGVPSKAQIVKIS